MRELRKDPIIFRWVIISTERAKRPTEKHAGREEKADDPAGCPFEEGSEASTPPEIYALRKPATSPDTPGWRIRVTPNKYPALLMEGDPAAQQQGLFTRIPGVGAHETVIETPDHFRHLEAQPLPHLTRILEVFQQRICALRADPRIAYVLVFRNQGRSAGASLHHPHSQIVGLPVIPTRIEEELAGSLAHWKRTGECVFCDLTKQVLEKDELVVHRDDGVLAFCPYASIFPYETWILPEAHQADFADAGNELLAGIARALKVVLMKHREALGKLSYNMVLHTLPSTDAVVDDFPASHQHYHWHLEIYPRLTQPAGCEWGAGIHINPKTPEEAAMHLRSIKAEVD